MSRIKKVHSFNSVINRLKNISIYPGSIETIKTYQTSAGLYPLIKIVLGKGNSLRALISAGIHGDEPGGIESIINFLKNSNYLDYINEWEITLLPCINPYGYEFGTRTNHQGKDLNRLFKLKNPPEEVVFAQSILETDFKLIIDLHEDNESHGYYLYQTGLSKTYEKIGLEILNSLEGIMPINLETEIAGSQADQGIIGKELEILSMDWWPMALYGLSKGTQMCLTLETSSLFDMETRVHAHLTAIKTAFKHFQ
tara:strand:- start:609 stop:1370 length:762 start_codon:yes stop_codon:yes gene_type:complete